jgi:NAD(P)H-dependent flavin oxidoreductase YrpB (nitropropane dioxygenase family)
VVKQKFLAAKSSDTIRSRSLTGKPARMLRTAWTEEWERPDAPAPLPMPLQSALVAEAQERIHRSAHHPGSGAETLDTYFVGQVVGTLNHVKTARQVVLDMIDEYVDTYERLRKLTEED